MVPAGLSLTKRITVDAPRMAAPRPIAVTGFKDVEDEDDSDEENSEGAKRVLARLGVAMAR